MDFTKKFAVAALTALAISGTNVLATGNSNSGAHDNCNGNGSCPGDSTTIINQGGPEIENTIQNTVTGPEAEQTINGTQDINGQLGINGTQTFGGSQDLNQNGQQSIEGSQTFGDQTSSSILQTGDLGGAGYGYGGEAEAHGGTGYGGTGYGGTAYGSEQDQIQSQGITVGDGGLSSQGGAGGQGGMGGAGGRGGAGGDADSTASADNNFTDNSRTIQNDNSRTSAGAQAGATGNALNGQQTSQGNVTEYNSVVSSRWGAATNVPNHYLESARFAVQTCVNRFSVGASGGMVFLAYAGLNFTYHPSIGVFVSDEETGAIFSAEELYRAKPLERATMTRGMSEKKIALAMCTGQVYADQRESQRQAHAFEIAKQTHRHNLGRHSNVPGSREGASTMEHMAAHLYTGQVEPGYMKALKCGLKGFAAAGGTGAIDQRDAPTPTQGLMAMFGIEPAHRGADGKLVQPVSNKEAVIAGCGFEENGLIPLPIAAGPAPVQ